MGCLFDTPPQPPHSTEKKWDVGWGPVSACNMNCQFCYSKKARANCSSDLTLKEWLQFIDSNHELIHSINYGTGENAISDDWFSLIYHIRKSYPDIRQSLTSNGYVSQKVKKNKRLMEYFVDSIDEVDISLDFCTPERHNELRGQPHAFAWAMEALSLCHAANKPLTLCFIGSAINTSEENLTGLFEIAHRYNALVRMNIFRPMDMSDLKLRRFIIGFEEVCNILAFVNDKYQILSLSDPYFSALFSGPSKNDPSGISSLRILSNGNITPSTYLISDSFTLGNIRQQGILHELESSEQRKEIVNDKLPAECQGCVLAGKCKGGVLDRRFLWYGSSTRKDPYCPRRFDSLNQLPAPLSFSRRKFTSVHDGYLPTMFFSFDKDQL